MITGKADPKEEHQQKWIKLGKTIKQGLNCKNEIAGLKYEKPPERSQLLILSLVSPTNQICK